MKKVLTVALIFLGIVHFFAQVETERKSKRERKRTDKTELSVDKEKIANDYRQLKNKTMAIDTAQRRTVINMLTNATVRPNFIFTASHRAQYNGGTEPENSMEAIKDLKLGTADQKVWIVELDIKKSKDDTVYVMHDDYLQRTTDFLDKFLGVGGSSDEQKRYGNYDYYTWAQVSRLTLRNAKFEYTDRKVPLFRDVLRYIKNETPCLINLDIGDINVFRAVWKIVKEEDAFNVCIFKSAQIGVNDYHNQFFMNLSENQKRQVMFFPMIIMSNPGHPNDPMGAYNEWEKTCDEDNLHRCLAKGYELGYRGNPGEDALLNVVDAIRGKKRVRVHVFNTYPDTYEGRYKGNVNVGQCCNDAYDARGDWNFLLDPRNTRGYDNGVNGYIITDDPELLDEYLSKLNFKSTNP